MTELHIAQLNIAHSRDSMESETMQGFVERLDEINSLADNAQGFVWRLQTEEGNATALQVFDDPLMIVNLSVWQDVDSLKNYVYKSLHLELIQNKEAWFHKSKKAHLVLWWIPAGHIPSVEEAKQKLSVLQVAGPSEDAFTFARPYPMPLSC